MLACHVPPSSHSTPGPLHEPSQTWPGVVHRLPGAGVGYGQPGAAGTQYQPSGCAGPPRPAEHWHTPRGYQQSVTCSNCGGKATVPFQPRGDKPVYCRDCFQSRSGSYR